MKKTTVLSLSLMLATMLQAQTLNVVVGDVTYAVPSEQAGEMTYTDGKQLAILGKEYDLSEVSKIYIDESEVTDNRVSVVYDGNTAKVTVAGNIAQYITTTVEGAHVTLAQSSEVSADNVDEITYALSGTSQDGEFTLSGSYKCRVEMDGLTLTNPQGAAVDIQNGKRIALSIEGDNTLTDGADGSQKACLVIKGHPEITGSGTLTLRGNTKHAYKSGEYTQLKKKFTGSIIVASSVGDGLHIGQYLEMNNGTITVKSCGDDGIQIEAKAEGDENDGQVFINGGTIDVTLTAQDVKGLKCDSLMTITGGSINITATTSSTDSKGIKSGGDMVISGGTINVSTTGNNAEGIESKGILTINDGVVTVNSRDDGINSASHMYLKGGTVTVVATGNDAIDSNGNLYISGGTIVACGASAPECGFDAAEQYKFYITGGHVLGIGGGNNAVTATSGSQCVIGVSGSVTGGSTVSVKNSSMTLASFTVPSSYTSGNNGGGGGYGGGPGGGPGGGGSSLLISCPGMTSGTSYSIYSGSNSIGSGTASTTYSGNGGGGGHPWGW